MNVDNKQKNELIKSSQFLVLSIVPSQLLWRKNVLHEVYNTSYSKSNMWKSPESYDFSTGKKQMAPQPGIF